MAFCRRGGRAKDLKHGHSTTVSIEVSKTFDLGSNPSARATESKEL